MTEPVSFASATPRYSLPLLFVGQAQKEFYINNALTALDLLVHTAISGVSDAPPASPNNGDVWLVSTTPQGEWIGHEDEIAFFTSNAWIFIAPLQGMRIFDISLGQQMHFDAGWKRAPLPAAPQGGAIIDAEARLAIDELIAGLREVGIFAKI